MKPPPASSESDPRMTGQPRTEPNESPPRRNGDRELIGLVESDRYCDECGFNLRGQNVFRDGATRLLLVQCSECARLHPANSLTTNARGSWFRRLSGALLLVWVVALLLMLFIAGVIEAAMQIATTEVLDLTQPVSNVPELASRHSLDLSLFAFMSFAIPAACMTLLSVAAHHWRWWGAVLAAIALPLIPAAIVHQGAHHSFPDSAHRMLPYFLAHTTIQIAGGVAGATLGRPLVRVLATLFVPPRARQALGFLWLADGKPPPALDRPAPR